MNQCSTKTAATRPTVREEEERSSDDEDDRSSMHQYTVDSSEHGDSCVSCDRSVVSSAEDSSTASNDELNPQNSCRSRCYSGSAPGAHSDQSDIVSSLDNSSDDQPATQSADSVDPDYLDWMRRGHDQVKELNNRRTDLKNNQVLAALYFIRRLDMFIKYIVKHQPLVCGRVKDWIIRYETQGRGSVHAHVLWWIDMNPDYVADHDKIDMPEHLLRGFDLIVRNSTGEQQKIYNELFLNYTNGNIWAMQDPDSIRDKLQIGVDQVNIEQ